jgi:hypothetical protein
VSQPDRIESVIKLSTGYEVEVDLDKPATSSWRGHLARAILGERVLAEAKNPTDRPEGQPDVGTIPEEIRHLLATMNPSLKDALLYQIVYDDVLKLAKRLDRKIAKQVQASEV